MSKTGLEKRIPSSIKEKGQYALAFGVIAVLLFYAGFPIFILLFFGVLAFFIWKVLSFDTKYETRRIFEFYLSANEILRDDDRRWYGFEIQEAIARGEAILRSMSAAPPLVHFGLGALYQKLDDHSSAAKHLAHVVEESAGDESAIVFPTKELREYVRMLRKIERTPAEAPLTSAAIRSLERARKNRGKELLEQSRVLSAKDVIPLPKGEQRPESVVDITKYRESDEINAPERSSITNENQSVPDLKQTPVKRRKSQNYSQHETPPERQSISEVLHDLYDKNVQ